MATKAILTRGRREILTRGRREEVTLAPLGIAPSRKILLAKRLSRNEQGRQRLICISKNSSVFGPPPFMLQLCPHMNPCVLPPLCHCDSPCVRIFLGHTLPHGTATSEYITRFEGAFSVSTHCPLSVATLCLYLASVCWHICVPSLPPVCGLKLATMRIGKICLRRG